MRNIEAPATRNQRVIQKRQLQNSLDSVVISVIGGAGGVGNTDILEAEFDADTQPNKLITLNYSLRSKVSIFAHRSHEPLDYWLQE